MATHRVTIAYRDEDDLVATRNLGDYSIREAMRIARTAAGEGARFARRGIHRGYAGASGMAWIMLDDGRSAGAR